MTGEVWRVNTKQGYRYVVYHSEGQKWFNSYKLAISWIKEMGVSNEH